MCRTLAPAGFVALLLFALTGQADVEVQIKDNTPPDGFKALFNGIDLTGWKGLIDVRERERLDPEQLAKKQAEADKQLVHWKVEDGILHFDGHGQNLQTAKDYANFEMYVDWKIKNDGDSGIYLRGNPQVQIWDPDSKKNPREDWGDGSGGLWNNKKHSKRPALRADKPIGEWNTFHIIMKGDKVTVFLNGKKVVDEVPLENYWFPDKPLPAKMQFELLSLDELQNYWFPDNPLPAKGPIELQSHGDELWFKNIYIKELPD
jgi:hypothetical protein